MARMTPAPMPARRMPMPMPRPRTGDSMPAGSLSPRGAVTGGGRPAPMPERPMPTPPMPERPMPEPQRPMPSTSVPPMPSTSVPPMPAPQVMPTPQPAPMGAAQAAPMGAQAAPNPMTMKRGGRVKKMASGGMTSKVSSASKRGDGIAQRGKTKGRYI